MTGAVVCSNGEGGKRAVCRLCGWRGPAYGGPFRSILAQDDADEHDDNKHVNRQLTVAVESITHGTHT